MALTTAINFILKSFRSQIRLIATSLGLQEFLNALGCVLLDEFGVANPKKEFITF